jgi:hypothetical protein
VRDIRKDWTLILNALHMAKRADGYMPDVYVPIFPDKPSRFHRRPIVSYADDRVRAMKLRPIDVLTRALNDAREHIEALEKQLEKQGGEE